LAAFLVYTGFFATGGDCGCLLFPISTAEPPRSWLLGRDALAFVAAIVVMVSRKAQPRADVARLTT
jgi:hypothetical protein